MSQENVEIVREYFAATNRRDFASVMDSYPDEVVLVVSGLFPGGTYSGREAVGAWFGEWFSAFGHDYYFELLEAREVGARVFATARHRGSGRASGVRVEATNGYAFSVTAGKIARVELYADPAAALKAVGLEAMSQKDVDVVRHTFDAIFSRDFRRATTGFHPYAVWHNTREFPGPSICVGPQDIAEFWETLWESFDGETSVEQIIDGEDGVALGAHTAGRGTTSGVPLDIRWGIAVRVASGKISRVDVYGNWAKALKAVGLAE